VWLFDESNEFMSHFAYVSGENLQNRP
jgi:hypothetical protein